MVEESNVIDSKLQYKDHSEYFEKYYEKRDKVNNLIAELLLDKSKAKELLKELIGFLNWSSLYIENIEKKRETFQGIVEIYSKTQLKEKKELTEFFNKINTLWDEISKDNKKYEILPKPIDVEDEETDLDKYWKNEGNIKIREAKKAFSDMLKNYM